MKHPDYDRAFAKTPVCISAAIEIGFRKGQKCALRRRRIIGAASVAAVLALTLGVALTRGAHIGAPKPDVFSAGKPRPGRPTPVPAASAVAETSDAPTPTDTIAPTDTPTPTDTPMPTDTPTPTDTPMPTEEVMSEEAPLYTAVPMVTSATNVDYAVSVRIPETEIAVSLSSDTEVYTTAADVYYHLDKACSGMSGAVSMSLRVAEKIGKQACPVCAFSAAHPDMELPNGLPSWDYAVYVNADDAYYHWNELCRAVVCGSDGELISASNAVEMGRSPCPVCAADLSGARSISIYEAQVESEASGSINANAVVYVDENNAPFYYTTNGVCFHLTETCSGMRNAYHHNLEDLLMQTKRPCPICFYKEELRELYRLSVPDSPQDVVLVPYYSGINGYYHRDPSCYGSPVNLLTTRQCAEEEMNLAPCPACLGSMAKDDSPACYVCLDDGRYHSDSACPLIAPECDATTEVQAQAAGMIRCSACAAEDTLEYQQFVQLFGQAPIRLEDGDYVFERRDILADGSVEWYVSDGFQAGRLGVLKETEDGGRELRIGDSDVGPLLPARFFPTAPEPLNTLYAKSVPDLISEMPASLRDMLGADAEVIDWEATPCSATLHYGADGDVQACELAFWIDARAVTLYWQRDAKGEFQLDAEKCHSEALEARDKGMVTMSNYISTDD